MKHFLLSTYILLILTVLFSCGKKNVLPQEYIAWSDDVSNNLVKVYEQNGIKLTCQYTSPEYAVLKQNGIADGNEQMLKENINELADIVQFKLKFERLDRNNFLKGNYTTAEEFNIASSYLSFGIKDDVKLIAQNDTVKCITNHHERTYGNTPYELLLFSFPKVVNDEINDLELVFDDRVFGLGRVKFFFDKNDLAKIPNLVFE